MARLDRRAPSRWIATGRASRRSTRPRSDAEWFDEVTRVAGQHPRHPRLRRDLEAYVRAVFACARDCMAAFHDHKTERGLLDFVDQEALALQVVNDPANHARLREAIHAVFVDEFQDSSPIQLALFAALARVARQSVWVGDPKQSIYAFRDAAPELTLRAARGITERSGGQRAFLAVSYRARPPLTEFVNAAFGPSFATAGFAREEVAFDACHRPEPEGAAPAFACWEVGGRNAELRTAHLAAHVAEVVRHAGAWPIEAGGGRAARGGDVAVLCRTNTAVGALASALAARGVRVSVERGGLMHQPEVELALAALRWVADRADTLAAAELARLAGEDGAWLEVAFAEDVPLALGACVDFAEALEELRARTPSLTPAEALDAVLNVEGLLAVVRAWHDAEARLANLEALRAVAEEYQSTEHAMRRAVTLQGLCNWLMDAGDASQPKNAHPDAVHLLTYHGAKGLQWPIVVLTDLEAKPKANPFGVDAEGPAEPDPTDPLADRVVRFWPWPYGPQKKDVGLDQAAAASPQGQRATHDELLERRRLLYVGMTRAQDYLVLARDERKKQTWLDELQDADGEPLVRIDDDALIVGGQRFATRPEPQAEEERTEPAGPSDEFGPPPSPREVHRPKSLTPSAVQAPHAPTIVETVRLGDRIPLAGRPDMQALGEACHRFFAWDRAIRSHEARLARAHATLDAWSVTSIAPGDLVGTSDRLRAFLAQRYPNASLQHEVPVFARVDGQLVSGRLDLVVDTGDAIAIVDHKSLPLWLEGEEVRLRAFAAQIDLYRRAVAAATNTRCTEAWLHQPITGAMSRVELGPVDDGDAAVEAG
ncbi:MAG: UvrD-helicase domain-containing protein [Trueperaceae bacterium]|nr:UvrD-helicase domain-containing protein [Trueperaceae bacterium]